LSQAARLRALGAACLDRRRALAAAAVLLAGGCTLNPDADHDGPDAPRVVPLARPVRMAWVLGSGGPRGFTHVGVLRALEDLGLVPDLIVGASVGAAVGALRAAGRSARELEALALGFNALALARLSFGSTETLSGAPVAEMLRAETPVRLLERMPIAMACVALRRRDGQCVAFTAGDVGVAVQASAAIPGRFAPVRIRGELFLDADDVTPLPVRMARALGARLVLAIDPSAHVERAPPGAARYRESDQRKRMLIQPDAEAADLVLKPDFGYWVSLSREFRERAISAGYRDAMAQAAALRALHVRHAGG
jgi:NTE family protein